MTFLRMSESTTKSRPCRCSVRKDALVRCSKLLNCLASICAIAALAYPAGCRTKSVVPNSSDGGCEGSKRTTECVRLAARSACQTILRIVSRPIEFLSRGNHFQNPVARAKSVMPPRHPLHLNKKRLLPDAKSAGSLLPNRHI